jgi:tetratricopeptide (TPR) repeat protein
MMKLAQSLVVTTLLALVAAGGSLAVAEEVPVTPDVGPPSEKSAPRTGEHGVRALDLDDKGKSAEPSAEPGTEQPGKEAAPSEAPTAPGLRERYRAARKGNQGDQGLMGLNFPQTPEEANTVLGKLFAALATMEDEALSMKVTATIERIWRLPGGDTVNLIVDRAVNAANTNNPDLALKLLDSAVDLAPDYAEAFSRRAFVYYMKGDTERAVGDLRRVLALEPNHFKALEGIAKILQEAGQKKGALKALEELVKVNPHAPGAKTSIENLKKEVEGQGI